MSASSTLITEYLGNGGFFNPEMMDHDKVRDMLIDLRDQMVELEAIREHLWPNQTGVPNRHRNALVAIKARERLGVALGKKREEQFNKMLGTLTRIWKHYQTPAQLQRNGERDWGCSGSEAIEYAYENIQAEAKGATKGVRPIAPAVPSEQNNPALPEGGANQD